MIQKQCCLCHIILLYNVYFQTTPRGLYLSVTIVITFHPMFITMVDRAYNVQCFYMEADKEVSAQIGVR